MFSDFVTDMLNFAKTAKAWWSGVVVAVGEVLTLWQVAAADEAISLDEAKGLWLAATQAATVVLGVFAVWKARNKGTVNGSEPVRGV